VRWDGDRVTLAGHAVTVYSGTLAGLFAPGTALFAWYSIGLLAGMALFFAILGRFNGLQHLATVMNVRTEALGGNDKQGPNRPQASSAEPAAEEVS
jgi:hypothetical protein